MAAQQTQEDDTSSCKCCNPVYIAHLGDTVCQDCGLVLSSHEMIEDVRMMFHVASSACDDSSSSNNNGRNHQTSLPHVGLPIDVLLPNMSLGTNIGGYGKQAARQRRLNLPRNLPYVERALLKAIKEISAGCNTLGLTSNCVTYAKHLLATVKQTAGVRRGAVFRALPAVSTYFAAKLTTGCYRPREMVCQAFGIEALDFSKCYKHVLDCSRDKPYYQAMVTSVDPTSLTMLMLNSLVDVVPGSIHGQIRRTVIKMHDLVVAKAPDLAQQKDVTLIAAEVLVACELHGLSCPRPVVAACAGVSHVTLARYLKKVRASLEKE